MPRKKTPEGNSVDAGGDELKAVRLELPIALHQWLRIEAAKNELSMAMYVRKLVEDNWKSKTAKG